jgi:hypothetical protein
MSYIGKNNRGNNPGNCEDIYRGRKGPPGTIGRRGSGSTFAINSNGSGVIYDTSEKGIVPSYHTPFILGSDHINPSDTNYFQYDGSVMSIGKDLTVPSSGVASGVNNELGGDENTVNGDGNTANGDRNLVYGSKNESKFNYSIIGGVEHDIEDGVGIIMLGRKNGISHRDPINSYIFISGTENNVDSTGDNDECFAILASMRCSVSRIGYCVIGSDLYHHHDNSPNNYTVFVTNFENMGSYQSKYIIKGDDSNISSGFDEYTYFSDADNDNLTINLDPDPYTDYRSRFIFNSESNPKNVTINSPSNITNYYNTDTTNSLTIDTTKYAAVELQYSVDNDIFYMIDIVRVQDR